MQLVRQAGVQGCGQSSEKTLQKQSRSLTIVGSTPSVSRALAWCGLGYLRAGAR